MLNIGRDEAFGPLSSALAILDRPTYAVIARPPPRRRPRGAPRHPLAAAAGADRGGRGAERQRTARRAADPRPRRPRDDRQLALLGLGAAGPQPRRPRGAARRGPRRRGRRGAGRGDDRRGDALAAGGPDDRPPGRPSPGASASTASPADTPIAMSILLVHHREDLYPEPFAFRPERWLGPQARHLRVDPLRRRHPPLPRRRPGDGRAARRARDDGPPPRPRGRRPRARAGAAPQRDDDPGAGRPGRRARRAASGPSVLVALLGDK